MTKVADMLSLASEALAVQLTLQEMNMFKVELLLLSLFVVARVCVFMCLCCAD